MTVFRLILALLGLFVLAGVGRHAGQRLARHGIHALTWRFLTGQSWHGKANTNRGWTRSGTKALTVTGYTHRRQYLPRWRHTLWRVQWVLVTLLTGAGLLFQFRRATQYLAVTALAAACYGLWCGRAWAQDYGHRKNYYKPLHARLAATAGIPLAMRPESWLDVPRDLSYVELTWPKGALLPRPEEKKAIESTTSATVGYRRGKPSWRTVGPHLKLRITEPVPPPWWVYLDGMEWHGRNVPDLPSDAIRRALLAADPDTLVLGIGEDGQIVTINLKQDSPHMALSVDTGKGKSVLVRCLTSQVLMRGGIVALLDNKLVSHPSLRALPNVAYADDIDKIHDFLEWLDGELTRRAEFIRAHTDFEGNLTGSPGPRLVVFLEEQNLLMNRLRSYWAMRLAGDKALPQDMRENLPAVSPAIRGFENASYVGRELKVHLVFIAQRFTAEAAGGGSKGAAVRMNAGVRILAGYDDDTWKMLVGKGTAMPAPSKHEGRMQLFVKGGDLTEVQMVFVTHKQTRQFAEAGTARVPSALRHLTEFRPSGVTDPRPPGGTVTVGSDGGTVIVTAPAQAIAPPPVRNWMTIRQAKEAGMLPHTWKNPSGAFGTVKNRAKKEGRTIPEVKGWNGTQAMYDATELADFLEELTAAKQGA